MIRYGWVLMAIIQSAWLHEYLANNMKGQNVVAVDVCHLILSSARKSNSWSYNAIGQNRSKTRFKNVCVTLRCFHRLSFFNLFLWLKFMGAFRSISFLYVLYIFPYGFINCMLFFLNFPLFSQHSTLWILFFFLLLSHFILFIYFCCYLMLMYILSVLQCVVDACIYREYGS